MVDHLTHLDDCGNVNAGITNGGGLWQVQSYDFGNGFTAAVGYAGGETCWYA